MNNLKILFGNRLKQLRKANNLTQEQLAEKLELSLPNISYIETGKVFPSVETQEKICNVLNLKYCDLYQFNELPNTNEMKTEIINAMNKNPEIIEKIYKIFMFI